MRHSLFQTKGDSCEYHFTLGMWIRNNWIYEQDEGYEKKLAAISAASLRMVWHHHIQLAVPKLVAIAVRMVITTCITVFHVSFFIVLPFLLNSFISHLPPP